MTIKKHEVNFTCQEVEMGSVTRFIVYGPDQDIAKKLGLDSAYVGELIRIEVTEKTEKGKRLVGTEQTKKAIFLMLSGIAASLNKNLI